MSGIRNWEIQQRLKEFDIETRGRLLDALEAVKQSGAGGITLLDWVTYMEQRHGADRMLIRSVLRSVLEDFSFVVRRVDEQRYGWVGLAAQLGGEGGADEVKSAIGGQVGITYDILDVVRQMGIFSAQDVQAVLLRKYHFSKETAEAMVEHFVRQLEGMLEVVGPSRWRYRGETSTTQEDSMAMLRSLASFKRH